ncbi:hypothetical protein AB0K12_03455 [Nonomuraea sp. NPDC049419]|uniref:hypothetical protein n=1 Tax=Nonomuraea sp. NPDC049419 TaxID=3155772 RepID=UPI003416518A
MTAHEVEPAPAGPEHGGGKEPEPGPGPAAETTPQEAEPKKSTTPPPPPPPDEPGSEEEQRRVDTERDRRARGLRFFLGPAYYAGTAGAGSHQRGPGRDSTTSSAMRDAHSYHADDMHVHHTYNYYAASDFDTPPRFGGLTWDRLDLRQKLHVRTRSDERLRDRLWAERVVILCGGDGTGRRDSALWALAEFVPVTGKEGAAHEFPVEITEVDTIAALFPRAQGWQAEPGRGYVLDASGLRARINRTQLDGLRGAAGADAWVVVLAADFALADDLYGEPEVIAHEPPAVLDVLDRHLWTRLEDAPPAVVREAQRLLDEPGLADELGRLRHPAQAVRLAGDLALQLLDGMTAAEVLSWLPGRRREELREKFLDDELRHQALPLVAAAVFQGQPVGKVVRASERLLRLVPPRWVRPDPFEHVIPPELDGFVRGFGGLNEPEAQQGADPPVILRPESLGRDVLTVVWRDRPGLRGPLLAWLESMAEDGDPALRIQASQAVGMFAVLDFDHLADTTLRRWRDSGEHPHKQAFRWALEAAAGADERTAERVRRLLRAGGSLVTRGTLVDAYGTRIGALFPGDALRAIDELLRDAARRADALEDSTLNVDTVDLLIGDRRYRFSTTFDLHRIAAIVTEIFAGGASRQVLNRLHDWAGGPPRRREMAEVYVKRMVATRAMVRVARLPAPGATGPRSPALLLMLARDEVSAERLHPIWRAALADRDVGRRAWDVLRLWLEAADGDERLIEPVRDVVQPMATEHGGLERRRFYHQIQQWKRRRGGASFRAFPLI